MDILAYGEDGLTLWALKKRLSLILDALDDSSEPDACQVFYRPSFGRSGGPDSSQFGEFDFILLSDRCVYLGESKWDGSSERIVDGMLKLRDEQLIRHKIMKFYIEEWFDGNYENWQEFEQQALPKLVDWNIVKPIAPAESILATNLQFILQQIQRKYTRSPKIRNILLYLYRRMDMSKVPQQAGDDFLVVMIDYTQDLSGNFIRIDD